ncbi:S24 family peptidase [Novosphingobium sp. SG720]|uniref:S24 family peptidase n=1 Tax=Novosphingobium sp. SG720 TaxID=2586998 RepID=UPI001446FA52
MFRGDRLAELLKAQGISQSHLARLVGVSQATIWKLLKEPAQGSKHTHRIARELGTSPAYLMGETDDPASSGEVTLVAPAAPDMLPPDTVEIAEFNVAYGLGGAFIHDEPARQTMRTFSLAWVRQFTTAPIDKLFWATSSGTSMMPAILDSDILLIDTTQQSPRMWDQFWAIEMHGLGMIKSLRPAKDGGMRLVSVNPDFRDELAYDGEMNVIGRVVAIVRKV